MKNTKNKEKMKKIFKMAFAVVAFAVSAFVGSSAYHQNVNAENEIAYADPLLEENIDASATSEMNPWYMWFSQGLTADEREEVVECTGTNSVSGSVTVPVKGVPVTVGGSVTSAGPKTKITCPAGSTNCSETDC